MKNHLLKNSEEKFELLANHVNPHNNYGLDSFFQSTLPLAAGLKELIFNY